MNSPSRELRLDDMSILGSHYICVCISMLLCAQLGSYTNERVPPVGGLPILLSPWPPSVTERRGNKADNPQPFTRFMFNLDLSL